ncbi:MAG TPA: class I SAM-dependent methyltransferase [Bryobacteraceae bacterium]|nr:class I SAM-dependent methyltransferase [Bryobacteraceae bacterium]
MPNAQATPEAIQAAYYTETAAAYDNLHTSREDDEHYLALNLMCALGETLDLNTYLDVGAGTGRGVCFLRERGKRVRGVEPVTDLIEQAHRKDVPRGTIIRGSGYHLPFDDASFDAVYQCGVLHHVADPDKVVSEMMRVARKAVFLSDENRFGQGSSYGLRLLKVVLYKAHLWQPLKFIQTRGRMYKISERDGLAYSYSVYQSYQSLSQWADRIWFLQTARQKPVKSWLNPLLTGSHVLLCAIRDDD